MKTWKVVYFLSSFQKWRENNHLELAYLLWNFQTVWSRLVADVIFHSIFFVRKSCNELNLCYIFFYHHIKHLVNKLNIGCILCAFCINLKGLWISIFTKKVVVIFISLHAKLIILESLYIIFSNIHSLRLKKCLFLVWL